MSAEPPQKLTKKQRKALAFRAKKGKNPQQRPQPLDVPEDDEIEIDNDDDGTINDNIGAKEEEKQETGARARDDENKKKKRKLDSTADTPNVKKKKKAESTENTTSIAKQKTGDDAGDELEGEEDTDKKPNKSSERHKRYILFVGNLKYTTSKDAILQHFSVCNPPPTVRLLAPKPTKPSSSSSTAATKSKGCAFLEFSTRPSLQSALTLHNSTLDGRQINVELTAGGGGKSASRLERLRARNKELAAQRAKNDRKKVSRNGDGDEAFGDDRPQRHSTTSGIDIPQPLPKRTWSVPESTDDLSNSNSNSRKRKRGAKTGAGGKSQNNGSRKPRNQGTGVNAIPVG